MSKVIRYSVVIPLKEINLYVLETVERINNENRVDVEVIVLPNFESKPIDNAIIVPTGKIGPGAKRDVGAKIACGEWLIFLDDDSYPMTGYFSVLDNLISMHPNYLAFGGPGITPAEDSFLQQASGAVFISRYSGGSPERYMSNCGEKDVDDWPSVNFVINSKLFNEIDGFNTVYWPGEDTWICNKLNLIGVKIRYAPKLFVWHHRRGGLLQHIKQVWNYGLHRGHFARIGVKNSTNFKYSIPSIFFIYILICVFSSLIFNNNFFWIFIPIYFFVLLFALFDIAKKNSLAVSLASIPYIVFTHLSYGVGYIIGIAKNQHKSRLR